MKIVVALEKNVNKKQNEMKKEGKQLTWHTTKDNYHFL